MRDIEFKGKSVDTGLWHYGYYVKECGNHFILTKLDENGFDSIKMKWCKVVPESVSEFTGYKTDETLEKIFEHDYVEIGRCKEGCTCRIGTVAEVIFIDGEFCLMMDDGDIFSMNMYGDFRIIMKNSRLNDE